MKLWIFVSCMMNLFTFTLHGFHDDISKLVKCPSSFAQYIRTLTNQCTFLPLAPPTPSWNQSVTGKWGSVHIFEAEDPQSQNAHAELSI